jgi:hypothetical protein
MVGAVAAVLLVLLFLLVVVLVAEHVGTNGTCYETAYGTQSSTSQLVSKERTTGTSNERRA